MTERIDDVLVVGGGDIGLLTALSVRQLNPTVDVTVVDDFDQDASGVGKSTYREIQQVLHGTLDIDEREFIARVRPIWKASVYFRDWCGYPSFQFPFDPQTKYPSTDTPNAVEYSYHYYDELAASPDHRTKGEEIVAQSKSPWYFDAQGDLDRYDEVAYHLDTERFNGYLRELCRDRSVDLVDDAITTVETTGAHVDGLEGERQNYDADLYVDATGFDRVLRSEQDVQFRDFAFPLDSALHAQVERSLSDVIPATVVETGAYGWFWHIDTYDHRDLGYVYASAFVDEDDAREEFREHVADVAPDGAGSDPIGEADVETYSFTSGYYDRAWVDNCLAIGNAEGFVEPLQSTGLTANATAAVRFGNLLSAHGRIADDGIRADFNAWVSRLWESIYDFISVHYLYADGETAFWQAMTARDVSPRVRQILASFDRNGFDWTVNRLAGDPDVIQPLVFQAPDFYTVMRSMGATATFYETNDFSVSDAVKRREDQRYQANRDAVSDYLTTRELYKGVMNF